MKPPQDRIDDVLDALDDGTATQDDADYYVVWSTAGTLRGIRTLHGHQRAIATRTAQFPHLKWPEVSA